MLFKSNELQNKNLNLKQIQTMRFCLIVLCLIIWTTVNHVHGLSLYATTNMANTQQYGDPAPGRSPGPPSSIQPKQLHHNNNNNNNNQLDDIENPTVILTVDNNDVQDVQDAEIENTESSLEENHDTENLLNLNDCDISRHDDIIRIEPYDTVINFTLTNRLFRTDVIEPGQIVEGVTYQVSSFVIAIPVPDEEIVEEPDDTRIIGGDKAQSAQFPFIVNLRFTSKNARGEEVTSKFCGGAIIADHWVLTAAHCIVGDKSQGKNLYILGGAVDAQPLMDPHGMEFKVKQTFMHPKYVHGGTPPHDIGLLYIKIKLPSNKFMQKIKLPNSGDMPLGNGTIAGWGAMDSDVGASQSRFLLTVSGPITSLEDCKKYYVTTQMEKQVCFGGKGRTACGGDSGGPLIQVIDGEPVLVGVSSFTQRPCGQKPSVYTRVSAYLEDFIYPTIKSIDPEAFKN